MQNVTNIRSNDNFYDKIKNSPAVNSLKRAWNDNPVAVMSAAGLLFAGAAKVLTGISSFRNSRSWDKEVKRREAKDRSRRYPHA